MEAGSAGHEHDAPAPPDRREVSLETTEVDPSGVKVDTATHGVDDGFGLLVDFLLHEVGEVSLHDGGQLDLEGLDGADGREAVVTAQAVDMELCADAVYSKRAPNGLLGETANAPPSAM